MKSPVTPLESRAVTVRISGIAAIPAVLEQLGVRPDDVFAAAQVDRSVFEDEHNSIGMTTVGRLVRECVARTGCAHFGILVGQHGGPHSFGLIGLAMRYTADVQSALTMLATYIHLYHGGQTLALEEHGDVAVLSHSINSPGVEAVDQIENGALAIFFNVLRSLCGPDWLPLEVRFAHRPPDERPPFHPLLPDDADFRRRAQRPGLFLTLAATTAAQRRCGDGIPAAAGHREPHEVRQQLLSRRGARRAPHRTPHWSRKRRLRGRHCFRCTAGR